MATASPHGFAAPLIRRRRRWLGATLMAGSLAAGTVLGTFGTATAQEAPSVPEGAEAVQVEAMAYYAYPYYDVLPNTLVREFPPGAVCLVRPDLPVCQPNPVSEGVEGGLGAVQENEPHSPAQPVPPDTLPAGIQNGEKRYESAVKFDVPTASEGEEIGEFSLVLTETTPTYHSSSPAFRQAVLAALTCARECQQEEFQKVLDREPVEQAVIGVEICPFTEPFEPGPSQEPPAEQPINTLYCTTAERTEGDAGIWVADLTFAAQAWASGEIPNHGVLIRPSGADNVAYGDPDPTTNAQVTFTAELQAASSTQAAADDPPAFGGGGDDSFGGDTGTSDSGDFSADSGGFASPSGGSSGSSGGFSSDPFSPPASGDGGPAPEVAPGGGDDAGVGGGSGEEAPVAGPATEPASTGGTWWLWLLIPIFAAGSWMTAQSLAAEPVVSTGALSRQGAMTRLIERNRAATPSTPMSQV